MSGGSLIYLGKNGTIKIDQKGRPKLYQWSEQDNVETSNVEERYGPTIIRIEGDTGCYDWSDHQRAAKKSENQGFHFNFKPSPTTTTPSVAVQRGTRIPVEVAGGPMSHQFKKHNDALLMPVQHTSTIDIDDVMQQHIQQQQLQNLQQQIHQLTLLQGQQHSHQKQNEIQQQMQKQTILVAPVTSPPTKTKHSYHNKGINMKHTDITKFEEKRVHPELQSKVLAWGLSGDGHECDDVTDCFGTQFEYSESEREAAPTRVAVLASVDTVVLVQATCGREITCKSPLLLEKMAEIAKVCLAYFRKLTSDQMELNSTALSDIILSDQGLLSGQLDVMQNELSDSVILNAVGRRANSKKFVGTFINDPCRAGSGPVIVGQTGVIVVLQGLNKLAPLKEFSDQLCHHIAIFRPKELGQGGSARPHQVRMCKQKINQCLLEEAFLYDSTITVWEAARRAFIDILDFIVLG